MFSIILFDLFEDIRFLLLKKFKFRAVTIFRLNYSYIVIFALLFYI